MLDLKRVNGEEGVDENHYDLDISYGIRIADIENICSDKFANDFSKMSFAQMAQAQNLKFENGVIIFTEETKHMKKTENGWVFSSNNESE